MRFDPTQTKIYVQDVTLRDGMHAIGHSYGLDHVRAIAKALDEAGVDAIEVAHGDGLSGTSFNYGFGTQTDWEWIGAVAEVLERAVLTTLILPGIATVDELRAAFEEAVDDYLEARDRRGRPPELASVEDYLLHEINREVSPSVRHRSAELKTKMVDEGISAKEVREFLEITDQVEAMDAKRLANLVALAQIRNISVDALMDQLGLRRRVDAKDDL